MIQLELFGEYAQGELFPNDICLAFGGWPVFSLNDLAIFTRAREDILYFLFCSLEPLSPQRELPL